MPSLTYAIGDIHGRRDLLDSLLDQVEADAAARGADAKIVFTGDYVDRGADSRGVIERLMAGPRRPQDRFVCLRGNHDALFAQAVHEGHGLPNWAWLLYWHTLTSYGLDRDSAKRDASADGRVATLRRHADFLAGLPLVHDDGTFFFVHGGIRPGVPLDRQTDEDLMWIRDDFLHHEGPLPRRVVHGHTIMGDRPVVTDNRVSIDTGAYKSGILTAAVIDGGEVRFLQTAGAPDRGAIVRELHLRAAMQGRDLAPTAREAFDDYVAGRVGLAEMEQRSGERFA